MKVGFYGHSACAWFNSPNNESFIDMLKHKHNLEIVNIGTMQGSEDRILFELKKTKKLDAAIIFHSHPRLYFIPKANRDVSANTIPENKAKIFWKERDGTEIQPDEFVDYFFTPYYNIRDVFGTPENFRDALLAMKEYFWHPDLANNRFYANILAINDYLSNKRIPSLQTIRRDLHPSWLKFQASPINYEITDICEKEREYCLTRPNEKFPNNMSINGNIQIFNIIDNWIKGL